METVAPTLVFDTLVEACNTERRERLTLPLAGGAMTDCVGSYNERLPLGLFAVCVLDGTLTGALCVARFLFFVTFMFPLVPPLHSSWW